MIDLVAVRKRWFKIKEYDPHTTKKTTQKNTKRNKAASVASDASKAKKTRASPSNDGNTDDESDDGIEMSQPLAKKAKLENDDDTAEDISAYIYVSAPAPPLSFESIHVQPSHHLQRSLLAAPSPSAHQSPTPTFSPLLQELFAVPPLRLSRPRCNGSSIALGTLNTSQSWIKMATV